MSTPARVTQQKLKPAAKDDNSSLALVFAKLKLAEEQQTVSPKDVLTSPTAGASEEQEFAEYELKDAKEHEERVTGSDTDSADVTKPNAVILPKKKPASPSSDDDTPTTSYLAARGDEEDSLLAFAGAWKPTRRVEELDDGDEFLSLDLFDGGYGMPAYRCSGLSVSDIIADEDNL